MKREIGSEFYLDANQELENKAINLDYLDINIADSAFISTGRSAISFILKQIKLPEDEKIALLPPFTCHTVIEPFIDAGYSIYYYRINRDLTCSSELFLEDLENVKPSVVIVHGYFGFDTLKPIKNILQHIKMKGTVVIEDITQTLYSNIKYSDADYYVFSFRKWLAIPDGGAAISTKRSFYYKPFKVDDKLEDKKIEAFHKKHLYINDDFGVKDEFLKLFREADNILNNQKCIYAMNPISKLIQANTDISFLRTRRRQNYNILLKFLSNSNIIQPIFDKLPEGIVPLYFPFYIKCDRNKLQSHLAKNSIYAPIVWPKATYCDGFIDEEAEWIYENILAIPCDQRYGTDDMKRIVEVIENYQALLDKDKISAEI